MKKSTATFGTILLVFPGFLLAATTTSSAYQSGFAVGHFIGRAIVILGICAIAFLLFNKFRNRK